MTKIKVIRNPESLDAAAKEAISQYARDGSTDVRATAVWQPRLFPDEGTDAIVYVTTKR